MIGSELLDHAGAALGGVAQEDNKFLYRCLNDAALDFAKLTRCFARSVDLVTVEGQQEYVLPPDVIELRTKDRKGRYVLETIYDEMRYWAVMAPLEHLEMLLLSEAKDRPSLFAFTDAENPAAITGTATAEGGAENGEAQLTDANATFETNRVFPGDTMINHTTGASGVVQEVVDETRLKAALFGGTTGNGWTENDAYSIVPAPRKKIVLDAPSKTAGITMRLGYTAAPPPVYSSLRQWGLDGGACRGIVFEAAFLYQADYDYRPENNRHLHAVYLMAVDRYNAQTAQNRLRARRHRRR